VIVMTPPQEQLHMQVLSIAGFFPYATVGMPGVHGVVTGTQGIGVSTPSAAAVAVATVGFAALEHMPNGAIFTMGAKSMMVAAGIFAHDTIDVGITVSVDGAAPNGHANAAPETTCSAIVSLSET
jgi:hypothetical protein